MMENWEGGDLSDIVRATGIPSSDSWHFPAAVDGGFHSDLFGDPLLFSSTAAGDDDDCEEEIEMMMMKNNTQQMVNCNNNINYYDDNNNIFSRMVQISTNHVSPCGSPAETTVPGKRVQISSSPGNTGIKRRRSQAKKVVCIPAPTPASSLSSRSTGEVVPSDLWAWRKYGQKPIKGSPYPRGYYRCSSSKGCSARKQVERSRNDPNMLVITYTSEHNHPWPTQRNALAGSTRSQPNKVGTNSKSKCNSQPHKVTTITYAKEEEANNTENSMVDSNSVKEEQMDMDGVDDSTFGSVGFDHDHTLVSYKPTLPDYNLGHCDDLFADLGEINEDSIGLLFGHEKGGNKFDHFSSLFDWNMDNMMNNTKDNPFCGDDKCGRL